MMNNLEVGVKFLMYPRFVQVFINNQLGDMSHHKGILVNPSLTKKVGLSARIISSDEEGLDDQEDASKQGRITEIDADEDLSLINETSQDQGRMNDQDMFGVNDLDGDEEKEEEANIAMIAKWDNTQVMMDADYKLAVKLQEKERGELYIEEKLNLFIELMNKRKKHFEMLRDEERRRKPPTKAKKRKQMSMDSKAVKDKAVESSNSPREELESDKSKKQKLHENVQAKVADDDTAELTRCMEIVPEDDYEVTIEATPLSSKSPTIVDYKIYKKRKKSYFKIIRADGNS
nr:hypothetical protein [Tanacetum cinerariifolium]